MQEAAPPWVGSYRHLLGRVAKNGPPIRKLLKIVAKSSLTERLGAGVDLARWDARAVSGARWLGPSVTAKPHSPAAPGISAAQGRDR